VHTPTTNTDWEAYTGRTAIDDSFDGVSFQGLVVYNWITSNGVPLFRVHFPDNDFQDLTLTELRSRLTEDHRQYPIPEEWEIVPGGLDRQAVPYKTGEKDTFHKVYRKMDIPKVHYRKYFSSLSE
jgi:hypothetical protein